MKISQTLLDSLTEQAKASPRLRKNLDLRNTPEDLSQRMLNAIEPGSVIHVHRHPDTSETVIVIRGKVVEIYYDDMGKEVVEAIELSPYGPNFAINVPKGKWHTLKSLESGTVILEVKDGPYEPTKPEDVIE